MNRFFTIILTLFVSATLFSQVKSGGVFEYRMDEQNMPYKYNPVFSHVKNGAVWRPLSEDYFYTLNFPNDIFNQMKYKYDTSGTLLQINYRTYGETYDYLVEVYNQTFTKENWDFTDTVTYYVKKGNSVIPNIRWYLDYHYYNRFPEDSFYYVQYKETWNDLKKEWEMDSRIYFGHIDTTLFIIREIHGANYKNGEWIKDFGSRGLREYNEDGLVTSLIRQDFNEQTLEFESVWKKEYIYNSDNIDTAYYTYEYIGNDTWNLARKLTDIQYTEWYPNHQPSIRINLNFYEFIPISGQRVKTKSFIQWNLDYDDEWEKWYSRKYDWDINGTKSNVDTIFQYHNGVPYLFETNGNIYDERGDLLQRWRENFSPLDMYGNVELFIGVKYGYHFSYHPQYGLLLIDMEKDSSTSLLATGATKQRKSFGKR